MTIASSTIARLLKDQRGVCWKCGRPIPPYHVHHACMTRDIRFAKWLDQIFNLLLICPRCHANHGWLSKFETRKKAWKFKVEQGYDMKAWHDSIPMIVKDNLDA